MLLSKFNTILSLTKVKNIEQEANLFLWDHVNI